MGDSTWDTRAPNRSNPPPPAGDPPVVTTPLPDPAPGPAEPSIPGGLTIWPVTTPADGPTLNRGYSYYPQAWVTGDAAYVFAHRADNHPLFFSVVLATGQVTPLGALLDPYGYLGEGEGLWWNAIGRIYLITGSCLSMVNPLAREDITVLDITGSHPGGELWQAHANRFDTAFSATVRQRVEVGSYPKIGTVFQRNGQQTYLKAEGELDESQIDASGRFGLIKETFIRDRPRLDNRILDFVTGSDQWLRDEDGAMGHSDMGEGEVFGEDDQQGAAVRMSLSNLADRRPLFSTSNLGHLSYRNGTLLLSDHTQLALVNRDTGQITHLLDHGMPYDPDNYNSQVFGSLDPSGRVATYWANGILYLVVLP